MLGRARPSMPDMVGQDVTDPEDETGGTRRGTDPTSRLKIGSRVVVRHFLEDTADGVVTDVVGRLVDRTDKEVVIDTRKGVVTVPLRLVQVAKPIPPRPARPGPAHLRVSLDDLALLTAEGWVALEQEALGSWLLRTAAGFTGRANSVLTVGDPELPLDEAIDRCEQWYAQRGQRAIFQVNGQKGFAVAEHPVAAALLGRGYEVGAGRADWARVLVMTGPAYLIPPLGPTTPVVQVRPDLTEAWLAAYGEHRSAVPGVAEAVLTGSERQLFLSVVDEGSDHIIALARLSLHTGWAGVFGLWVHPEHRRRGLARTMMSAISGICRTQNLPAIYLQVSADNDAAIDLYEALGFTVHHEYTYLTPPRS